MSKVVDTALQKVRAICLALPEAEERTAHSFPTFFVGKKVLAYFVNNHHGDGRLALWLRVGLEGQDLLVRDDPERFFKPAYVAHQGYVGVRLEGRAPWARIEGLIRTAWTVQATPKLKKAHPEILPG